MGPSITKESVYSEPRMTSGEEENLTKHHSSKLVPTTQHIFWDFIGVLHFPILEHLIDNLMSGSESSMAYSLFLCSPSAWQHCANSRRLSVYDDHSFRQTRLLLRHERAMLYRYHSHRAERLISITNPKLSAKDAVQKDKEEEKWCPPCSNGHLFMPGFISHGQ